MIAYIKKEYKDAIIYFSRLYTEYSKSGFNKNGMFYLGKSFEKVGKKSSARQTLEGLLEAFS